MEDKLLTLKNIVDVVGIVIKELEPYELKIVLGMVVDEFGARHDLTPEETMSILEDTARVQRMVFDECGNADYAKEA